MKTSETSTAAKPRVLFVDDDVIRMDQFKAHNTDCDITFACNCEQAIQAGVDFDFVFLDHDLGGAETILPYVNYLCDIGLEPRTKVVVHSSNVPGALNIQSKLKTALGANVIISGSQAYRYNWYVRQLIRHHKNN